MEAGSGMALGRRASNINGSSTSGWPKAARAIRHSWRGGALSRSRRRRRRR